MTVQSVHEAPAPLWPAGSCRADREEWGSTWEGPTLWLEVCGYSTLVGGAVQLMADWPVMAQSL